MVSTEDTLKVKGPSDLSTFLKCRAVFSLLGSLNISEWFQKAVASFGFQLVGRKPIVDVACIQASDAFGSWRDLPSMLGTRSLGTTSKVHGLQRSPNSTTFNGDRPSGACQLDVDQVAMACRLTVASTDWQRANGKARLLLWIHRQRTQMTQIPPAMPTAFPISPPLDRPFSCLWFPGYRGFVLGQGRCFACPAGSSSAPCPLLPCLGERS